MKKLLIYILSCCLLLVMFSASSAQSPSVKSLDGIRELAEKQYGPDPDLLNGRKYNFIYRSAEGNPFFEVPGVISSDIQIKGKLYEDQRIRFDIYNQLLILEFKDVSGARSSIVLNEKVVDNFTLGYLHFRKFPDKNGMERFGQVVYQDSISCVYFWKKDYLSELKDGRRYYRFTKPVRDAVIINGTQVSPFGNKKSFLKCFPKRDRKKIKTRIREQRINPRKANLIEMQDLLKYINQLRAHED